MISFAWNLVKLPANDHRQQAKYPKSILRAIGLQGERIAYVR